MKNSSILLKGSFFILFVMCTGCLECGATQVLSPIDMNDESRHVGGVILKPVIPQKAPAITTDTIDPKEKLKALTNKYTAQGLSFRDALSKAQDEINQLNDSALEKDLRDLGCTNWSDVGEITPRILETVSIMHNPNRGHFVLKPGLSIIYFDDKE
jgi:hypothetical protein